MVSNEIIDVDDVIGRPALNSKKQPTIKEINQKNTQNKLFLKINSIYNYCKFKIHTVFNYFNNVTNEYHEIINFIVLYGVIIYLAYLSVINIYNTTFNLISLIQIIGFGAIYYMIYDLIGLIKHF